MKDRISFRAGVIAWWTLMYVLCALSGAGFALLMVWLGPL